jgi:hypothetical protein
LIISHGRDNKLNVWTLGANEEADMDKRLPVEEPESHRRQPWLLHSLPVNTLNFCAFSSCIGDADGAYVTGDLISSSNLNRLVAVPSARDSDGVSIDFQTVSSVSPLLSSNIQYFHEFVEALRHKVADLSISLAHYLEDFLIDFEADDDRLMFSICRRRKDYTSFLQTRPPRQVNAPALSNFLSDSVRGHCKAITRLQRFQAQHS